MDQNSFDKKKLLEHPNQFVKESNKKIEDFVKEEDVKKFFMEDIDALLEKYEPGDIKNKPDVIKQMDDMAKQRKEAEEAERLKQQIMGFTQYQKVILEQQNTIVQLNERVKYLEGKLGEMIKEKIAIMKSS